MKTKIVDSLLPMCVHDEMFYDPDDRLAWAEALRRLQATLQEAPPLHVYVTPSPKRCPACDAFLEPELAATLPHEGPNCWKHIR